MKGFVATTIKQRPTVLVVDENDSFRWLNPVLENGYTDIGVGPRWRFYVDRSVGATAIATARASLAEVMRASDE